MRPLYESSFDLKNENDVSEQLSDLWDCTFHKLPISYHIDWMLMKNNKSVAFAELKTRKNSSKQYPTLLLSLAKWIYGNHLSKATSLPFLIIAKWTDGIFYVNSNNAKVTFGIGGRTDRNDNQDIEPVVYIDINSFKKV
jgi:hypothetical protein